MAYPALGPGTGLSVRITGLRVQHPNIPILTCMEGISEQTMAKFFHEFLIPVCIAHLTQFDSVRNTGSQQPQAAMRAVGVSPRNMEALTSRELKIS